MSCISTFDLDRLYRDAGEWAERYRKAWRPVDRGEASRNLAYLHARIGAYWHEEGRRIDPPPPDWAGTDPRD